jgi:acyl-CoA synthetase (AMP-forming)/AMP-acid ligase II
MGTVPTIHNILLRHSFPDPVPKLRFIRSASSALAPHTLAQMEAAFHAPVLEAYAMTEAAHQMTSNPLPPGKRKPGTVGLPQGVELSIRDDYGQAVPVGQEGEVCVRGPNVTAGYRNNPRANSEAFFADGHWFRTGDRGKLDADGYLTLTGRIKELINRGGEKISPIEVDAALLSCPGIKDAVSFAAPDEIYGEVVHCAVVSELATDDTDPNAAAEVQRIRLHCAQKLSAFKVPTRVYLMQEIPKTATGKVQRRLVAEKVLGTA